jgi:hypothetical protein
VAKLKRQLQARTDDLATQRAVNQQLMLKKEEVEWQLLAAIAQVRQGRQLTDMLMTCLLACCGICGLLSL